MQKEIREQKQEEQLYFQDKLPEEIRKELTPELLKQYYLWDEIIKREIQLHPCSVFPIIEEVFHKKYPENVKTELISTEYAVSRIHKNGEKILQSIYSDLVIRVGMELYHLECQMHETGDMVLRMLEYDVHIALSHRDIEADKEGKEKGNNVSNRNRHFSLEMPKSVILYLDNSISKSEYEECTIHFQDGGSYTYRVPVMRVQQYSPEMIEEKRLHILIPFLPIRFRDAIKSKSEEKRRKAQKNLTELLEECILILNHEKENGILTEEERNDITEFLSCACEHLYGGDAEVIREVHQIMEPIVWLRREMEQRNKELEKDIKDLQKSNTDLQKDKQDLQKDKQDLQENNKVLQEKMEKGLCNLIRKLQIEGKNQEEAQRTLEELFALSVTEAKEKVKLYWS